MMSEMYAFVEFRYVVEYFQTPLGKEKRICIPHKRDTADTDH